MKFQFFFLVALILIFFCSYISSKEGYFLNLENIQEIQTKNSKQTKPKPQNKEQQSEKNFREELQKEEKDEIKEEWENDIDNQDDEEEPKEKLNLEDETLSKQQIDNLLIQSTEEKEEKMKEEITSEQKEISDNSTNQFLENWEKYMKDFLPEDVINLKIAPWQQEVLIENLQQQFVPAYFRGAYLVYAEAEDDDIDFMIYDPNGELIWENDKSKQGMFFFNATIPGKYEFRLKKQVTFAFHNGKIIEEDAYKKKRNPMVDSISNSMTRLRDLMILSKMIAKRQDTHYETIIQTHRKIFAFTLFETLAIVFSSAFAIYYIKKLLDNKIVV